MLIFTVYLSCRTMFNLLCCCRQIDHYYFWLSREWRVFLIPPKLPDLPSYAVNREITKPNSCCLPCWLLCPHADCSGGTSSLVVRLRSLLFFYALEGKSTTNIHDLDVALARQFILLKGKKTIAQSSTISELK